MYIYLSIDYRLDTLFNINIYIYNTTCLEFLQATQVQRASSALSWLRRHGGDTPQNDLVNKISGVATGGRHLQNAERDLHRLLQNVSMSLAATPEIIMVRMYNPATLEIEWQPLPVLFPDTLLQALWQAGEDVFRYCLFGKMTEDETLQFWKHIEKHCPWFQSSPAYNWEWKQKVASVGTYGDEIQCYKNSECGVVSVTAWTAEFSTQNNPLLRYFPIAVWSEHCESEFTFADLEKEMIERWRRLTDPSLTWPWTSSGYLIAFTFCQGDLKWLNSRMGGLHNYRANSFCSRCECVKNHPNTQLTLPNMSNDPDAHTVRSYSSEQLQAFSPLLGLPGMCLERVMHDVAHSQYLGTGKTTNGSPACMVSLQRFLW